MTRRTARSLGAGGAGQAEGARGGQVQPLGDRGDEVAFVDDEQLPEAAVAEVRLRDDAEHGVPGGEPGDALADGLDDAGEVLAQDDGEAVLHHPLQAAGSHGQVEAVQ